MINLGADHRGFWLKECIKKYLDSKNIEYRDCGTDSTEIAHYPLIAKSVCEKMNMALDKAILICGSGIGMSMAANKFRGIRAGVCQSVEAAKDGKEHSNLNVLVLAGDFMDERLSIEVIETWMNSEFLNGRYLERIEMINEIERENMK